MQYIAVAVTWAIRPIFLAEPHIFLPHPANDHFSAPLAAPATKRKPATPYPSLTLAVISHLLWVHVPSMTVLDQDH
ncbi:hypothetical protein N658DRAFT_175732 [Parathielavia hyrcaniae]|uniref:Uncharacterized protein n=1 Tax=Parathielavia hyrcaniae TaxID=113614 RepID=A0AAN6QBE0_9PEZI|nr:hypothetical protein N658DRAFT_175732 [Parathielavia hyrcaniae]